MLSTANMDNMHPRVIRRRLNAAAPNPAPISEPETTKAATDADSNPVTDGEQEVLKDSVKDELQNTEKLDKLVDNSTTVIFKTKTVFPFEFFPHEIIITLSDVSVVFGKFFTSREIRTVSISKIAEAIVTTGVLFAQLKLIDVDYSQLTIEINYLPISDAMRAKRLIQGLLVSAKEGIDLTKVSNDGLAEKLEELGRVQGEKLDQE